MYISTTSYSREELNECLTDRYVLIYNEVEITKFGKSGFAGRLGRLFRIGIQNWPQNNP